MDQSIQEGSKGWETIRVSDSLVSVVPLRDSKPHLEGARYCKCRPSIQEDGGLVIHNSFDGREFYETEALDCDARDAGTR